ncbi:MAG: prepilin-type N-terminal cleavage/methylation domain-containing protein [Deltaproteobacteria bacterium]|nr:prepilin-type N-terminal cleavage/methylation domain-containing protein [Deltaproteobacteria bacterium]MBN2688037.1 prepilin-type N-terminal cleavage/methylation domain-containing protein [Deltaproteobacteria bacterium]
MADNGAIGKNGRAGFTLLEILVAIIILSMVLTTVYGAYTGTFHIIEQTKYSDDVYGMARTALTRMTEDLASLCPYGGIYSFVAKSAESGKRDFTDLTFLSSAHLDFKDQRVSGTASISYTVTEGSDNTGAVLTRTDVLYRGDDESDPDAAGGFILCKYLHSLTYTFYNDMGESFETWDSNSDTHKNRAPAVISISLNFVNPDDSEDPFAFMTKVYLPMAGASNAAATE